mgnify:CR=1 FL=1
MYPDLIAARHLVDAGAAAVMPLGAPIGSNKGLRTKDFIQILIDEIDLPVIVDAGIGAPSQACEAMEMGAAAVMANTAVATADNCPMMHTLLSWQSRQAVRRIWQSWDEFWSPAQRHPVP